LSHRTPEKAEPNVIKTIKWRAQPKTQEIIRMVFEGKVFESKTFTTVHKYLTSGFLPNEAQINLGPTNIFRGSLCNVEGLFENCTVAEQQEEGFIMREQVFLQNDRATRQTGKLAKQIIVFDMSDMQMATMMDRRLGTVHAPVSSKSAVYYPQLLSKFCLVNTPSWVYWVVAAMRQILPARNMAKIECFATAADVFDSEWGQRTFNRDFVPELLGGNMPDSKLNDDCSGAMLIRGDNEIKSIELLVGARTKTPVTFEVPLAGLAIQYTMSIVGYDIGVSASITSKDGKQTQNFLPESKLVAAEGMKSGVFTAPYEGTISLTFDNSYSMMRSKTVKYKFQVDEASNSKAADDVEKVTEEMANVNVA
jgi:hypothetical protein